MLLIPAPRKQRQMEPCEFEDSLVYSQFQNNQGYKEKNKKNKSNASFCSPAITICIAAGEMAQWLRMPAALEDLGSVSSTHMAFHNCL